MMQNVIYFTCQLGITFCLIGWLSLEEYDDSQKSGLR